MNPLPKAFQELLSQRSQRPDAPITIYHRDSIYLANKVCKSKQIWSEDGTGQANFHTDRYGGGSICEQEVTLIFEWSGEVAFKGDSSKPEPNILYWEPWGADRENLWSLTLAMGSSKGLKLVGVSHIRIEDDDTEREQKLYALSQMAKLLVNELIITVPLLHERTHTLASSQGRLSRFVERHFD